MGKKSKGDHVEGKKNKSPLWADLHAESHDIISDEQLFCSEDPTESTMVACVQNIAVGPEINLPDKVLSIPTCSRIHDSRHDKGPGLKIAMAVMVMMGVCVWSWVLVRNNQVKSPIASVMQAQLVGQTLLESTPVLLPLEMIAEKIVLPIDYNEKLGETILHIQLGKQALKERYISKAIANFMRARQILNHYPNAKADFLHSELNALHANALYWQGFLALQKDDQCQARAYFTSAQAMAPHDKKIQDRLKEIPASLGC